MTTPVTPEALEEAIRSRLGASHVIIEDVSGGCGSAFEVIIVSDVFKSRTRLQRNKLVFKELKDIIGRIHAFTQV